MDESSFEPIDSRASVPNHLETDTSSFAKTQDLRKSLQQKIADYGELQSAWSSRQAELADQCESLVSELKDTKRQFAVEKAAKRAKHLRTIDQMIQTHQSEVMRLQTQLNDEVQSYEDVDETLALDNEIENLKAEIKSLENEPIPEFDINVRTESRVGELEDRVAELQEMIEESMREREEDSRQSTKMLQDLIAKNKQADAQNQKEILKCIEDLNKLEKAHAEQVQKAKAAARDMAKQLSANLKRANDNAAKMQASVTEKQKQKKRQMKSVMIKAADLRSELQAITERQQSHMDESTELAKNCQTERREYIALHKELEMLNCELTRETVEHETLMKNLSKIDDMVINRMGRF